MRHLTLALLLSLPAQVAMAHQLTVFAYVEGTEVVVEAKFSSGRVPTEGEVRVFDAAETLLFTLPVSEGGETRFALPDGRAASADGIQFSIASAPPPARTCGGAISGPPANTVTSSPSSS